jgi:hypothetical protein
MNTRTAWKAFILVLAASALGVTGLPSRAYSQQAANLFTTAGNEAIHLDNAGGWSVCAEPTNTSWQITDVQVNTVMLISNGTGSVSQIPISNKTVIVADRNGNGLQDASFSFTQANLQALFSNFHGHKAHTVALALTGNLVTGGTFSGTITMQVFP